jgi:hypothetical protein
LDDARSVKKIELRRYNRRIGTQLKIRLPHANF